MERRIRVHQLWDWLPAFRAVAETEHLPTAAEELHVSASALSRTVKLLEDDLGVQLFRREGRRLVLDDAGERLLRRVRDAMRLVHEGIVEVRREEMAGPVRVSSAGVATIAYVVPAIADLLQAHPDLLVEVGTTPAAEVASELARGHVDVVFQSVPLDDERVAVTVLADATNGIYCARAHPLAHRAALAPEELADHAFAAPPTDALGRTWEGWPLHLPRRVRLRISQMHVGLEACASGQVLAVFPDAVARRDPRLVRLPLDLLPSTPVFAITRSSVGVHGRADRVVAAVAARVAADGPLPAP